MATRSIGGGVGDEAEVAGWSAKGGGGAGFEAIEAHRPKPSVGNLCFHEDGSAGGFCRCEVPS